MGQQDVFDSRDELTQLQAENLTMRTALETTDLGRALLRQGEEFSRLLTLSKLIVAELDLEKVFNLVADNAREIVSAELVLVPMLNDARDQYTYVAASGVDADTVRGTSLHANVGMCGWVLQHERSLLFGETSTHWMDETTTWEAGQQSAVLVPLIGRKGIIGGLSALGKQGGGCFTQHDLDLLTMFANQVSNAIENAQLFQQVNREIEDRKLTEDALRQSEERFRAIFENSQDAIGVFRNGIHLFVNPAYKRLFGRAPGEDVKGTPVLDLIAQGDRERIRESLHRRESGETAPAVYGTRGVRADGSEFEMEAHISSYREKNEGCTLAILRDITEQRKAEAALLAEKKFSDTIIDSLPGVFYICDQDGKLLRWNNNEKEVTGYSMEELAGMSVLQLFRDDRDVIANKMQEVLEQGRASVEARMVTKGGASIPFFLSAFRMNAGDKCFIVGVGIDISERKRLEDQLRQSQKMESIGTLAGGISHDFNNILTAIIGYGNLLQMKIKTDDPLRHNVDQILASANRAATLTQGLLAYSRKQILNPQPISLNDIIAKVERLLERLIGEDVELKTLLTDKDVTILADAGQIEQVLMNLATNARDAMADGGYLFIETEAIEVDEASAKTHDVLKPGAYALVAITDSGMGMDEQTRERIFEPFFTTKEMGKGTGLGLAMAYGIVKQHNGAINVYSEIGKGTTFKIYLPIVQAAQENALPVILQTIRGGTETILVAEDDEAVRALTSNMLEQFGYTVIQAENGEDAVNKFMANQVAVRMLLLDVIMPKKTGKEVYEKIRIFRPDVKALFLSGYTADIIHQRGLLDKDLDFILKPVPMTDLLRKVREILDRS